ncbi:MAG: flagellar brake protein [Pseudomonadota bacterium]
MADESNLVPVPASQVSLGKPLPWTVYDSDGRLLLMRGFVVETQQQLNGVISSGFMRDPRWDPPADKPKSSPLRPDRPEAKPAHVEAKEALLNMDEVRWRVGETLDLQPHDNPDLRYHIRLIGYIKNKIIFVTAPVLDNKYIFIKEGQTFIVRSFSGKRAYTFTSAAGKSHQVPHPFLLLSYPPQVRCTVIRKAARAQIKTIAAVTLGHPERAGAIMLTDMSLGGASGLAKQPLGRIGETGNIKFKVNVADQDSFVAIKTVLRAVTLVEGGEGYRHGFEFVDVAVQERLVLSAFVNQILVEGG